MRRLSKNAPKSRPTMSKEHPQLNIWHSPATKKGELTGGGEAAAALKSSLIPTKQKALIGFLSFLLVVPINMVGGSREGLSAPIAILVIPLAFLSFAKSTSTEALLLKIACLLGSISILIATVFAADVSLRPLVSMAFFFSPVMLYFLAREHVTTELEFLAFLRYSLFAAVALAASLYLSIFILGDGIVRTDGTMNGTFALLPLSGAYGVHTLVDHYFLICVVVIYYVQSGVASRLERIAAASVVLFLIYLMLLSLSREIVLAIVMVGIAATFRLMNLLKASIVIAAMSLCIYLGLSRMSSFDLAWQTKMYETIHADDLNDLSSGRVELQGIAIAQLVHSPVAGTGFYGYSLNYKSSDADNDLSGWSTHIYYLTTAWKMGLVAAIPFFVFLIKIVKKSIAFSRVKFPKSAEFYVIALCAFFVILNMLWDALLAPSVMCLFAFLVGCMSSESSSGKGRMHSVIQASRG
jgi:O-Antigen ligase